MYDGSGSYNNISALQVVDLPPSFRILNTDAFCLCENLTTINLNDNIVKIGDYALGLESGAYNANKTMKTMISALPTSLKVLGKNAFYGNNANLTITSIPAGVAVVSDYCFTWCAGVNVSTFGGDAGIHKLTTLGTHSFYGTGKGVTTIEIGSSITSIGYYAFYNGFDNATTVNFGRSEYVDETGKSITPARMGLNESKLTINYPT